ncbi:MAG: DEAD/DEAH box helicase family protein, partial [Actinomycetota bacterium]|nr:DEAD/DEAH box helicase family protein [Actinomycetota bacterium]
MRNGSTPLDVDAVLGGLKDFQRDTVDYVFRRLYEDEDAARRFLIADETGLGKTLVARGVIARAIDHLRGTVPRIDILYICSNADIARQNINRLNVTGKKDFALASRMTLLPTTVHQLEKNDLNFISFTPGTAFDLGNTMGRQDERALLYHLLREPWNLGTNKAPLNVLQGQASAQNFRNLTAGFKNDRNIDETLEQKFREDLERRIENEKDEGGVDIRSRFEELCGRFKQSNTRHSWQDNHDRKVLVGELRGLLATACLEALEPDLIILDEFQRFKHLLDGTDSSSELARGLFEYGDAKTLLLSATPYKMYTLSHESAEDDHYADFLRTLEFLEFGVEQAEKPQATLAKYRRSLFRLHEDGPEQAESAKRKLEDRLRRVMVRTEKLTASQNREGMLVEVSQAALRLDALDLEGYVSLRRVLEITGGGDALEYWKSAPYLLNFMDGYKLKQKFVEALQERGEELVEAMDSANGLLISSKEISRYAEVDPANAKLRSLLADTIEAGAWKLLWMPPSQTYYRPEGPFSEPFAKSFTKRLIFSSWRVVPKVVAAMVSYEAERHMIRSYETQPENSTGARARRGGLLQFAFSEGRLTGMPVLGILYPCSTLARECDPLLLGREGAGEPIAVAQMLETAAQHIEWLLEGVGAGRVTTGPEDEAWYWAAPILFDLHRDAKETREWFSREDLAGSWSDRTDSTEDSSRWTDHVEQARALVAGNLSLGRPPRDLSSVLASLALAGPGVAALRALGR